jgi:hypothetical protein
LAAQLVEKRAQRRRARGKRVLLPKRLCGSEVRAPRCAALLCVHTL